MSAVQPNHALKTNDYFVAKPREADCCSRSIKFGCSPLRITLTALIGLCFTRNLINSITFNFSSHQIDPLAKERFTEMEKKCHTLALKMGIKHPENIQIKLQTSLFDPTPHFGAFIDTMVFSPLFLMKKEDLPSHLDLSLLEKGEISEDEWIDSFSHWLFKDMLKITPPDTKSSEWKNLIVNLKVWLDEFRHPDYEKQIDFILCHELAHIKNKDSYFMLALPLLGLILSIAMGIAAAVACSFVLPVIISICVGIAAGYLALYGAQYLSKHFEHWKELRADKQSGAIEGNAHAGATFFETVCQRLKLEKQKDPNNYPHVSSQGDLPTDDSHPSPSKRAKLLRDMIAVKSLPLKA